MKVLDWYEFIFKADKEYAELAKDVIDKVNEFSPAILAGGTLRRIYEGQPYCGNDFDIYFESVTTFNIAFRAFTQLNFEHFTSLNAETFLIKNFNGYTISLQLIKSKFWENLLENFDFRCCMLSTNGMSVSYIDGALEDIKNKVLTPAIITNGYITVKRMMKFSSEGYNIAKKDLMIILDNLANKKIPLFGSFPSEEDCTVNDLLSKAQRIYFNDYRNSKITSS